MRYTYYKLPSRQRGSSIVMALFILVVLALLAASLIRLLADANRTVAIEVYSARAFMVAQSGADLGLVTLFPLGAGEGVGHCNDFPIQKSWGINCAVTVNCQETATLESTLHYKVTSQAVCGAGQGEQLIDVARTIEVEARGLSL